MPVGKRAIAVLLVLGIIFGTFSMLANMPGHPKSSRLWIPRIYVYPTTITEWKHCGCFGPVPRYNWNTYEMETQFVQFIEENPYVLTLDPEEADYFLVPHFSTCISHCVGREEAATYFLEVNRQIKAGPYYQRKNGSDHLYVFSQDYGSCWLPGITEEVEQAIRIVYFGFDVDVPVPWTNVSCFRRDRDVVIPPSAKFFPVYDADQPHSGLAFFQGTVLGNWSYSHGVRQALRNISLSGAYSDNSFLFADYQKHAYQLALERWIFSLCPAGWAPWSPRLIDSLNAGAIPVVIADGIVQPFWRYLDWDFITLEYPGERIYEIIDYLQNLLDTDPDRVKAWQQNILAYRKYVDWLSHEIENRDSPFYMLMRELYCAQAHPQRKMRVAECSQADILTALRYNEETPCLCSPIN